MTDILLINASNYPGNPIYPYAFVQLGALARQRGFSIEGVDLLGVPHSEYREVISRALSKTTPRLVGFHLRQADSVCYRDYGAGSVSRSYFPIDDSRLAVDIVRSLSAVPLVGGGFGFTVHASQTLKRLDLDYGIVGDGNSLFEEFDKLASRTELDTVPNLVYRCGGEIVTNARRFYPPNDKPEYDERTINELERFYGTARVYGHHQPTVAVELSRGCPFRCYFCTEPSVKGRTVRERDLAVVFQDIEFLSNRGLCNIWLVCSELNMGNSRLAVELAERFLLFNQGRRVKTTWRAYHLPKWLDETTLKLLYSSGFQGGWNDFPSFDDENLKKTRVPYRKKDAVTHLLQTLTIRPKGIDGLPSHFSIFLGNAFSSPTVVRNSLETFDELGIQSYFEQALVGSATRAFEGVSATPDIPGAAKAVAFSAKGEKKNDLDLVDPTYFHAPALLEAADSEEALLSFFDYVERCFLSKGYLMEGFWAPTLGWARARWWYQATLSLILTDNNASSLWTLLNSTLNDIDELIGDQCSDDSLVDRLIAAESKHPDRLKQPLRTICIELAQTIFARLKAGSSLSNDVIDVFDLLLGSASPYRCFNKLITQFNTNHELVDFVINQTDGQQDLMIWMCEVGIRAKGLVLRPEFGLIAGIVPLENQR